MLTEYAEDNEILVVKPSYDRDFRFELCMLCCQSCNLVPLDSKIRGLDDTSFQQLHNNGAAVACHSYGSHLDTITFLSIPEVVAAGHLGKL